MTIYGGARDLPCFRRLAMNLVLHWLARFVEGMALHTGRIGIRLVQLRRTMPRSAPIVGVIIPHVLHSADFREYRAEHAIIGMTNVTTLIAEIGIFAV